jgi:uncharacterized small protein (DUF1192 family)
VSNDTQRQVSVIEIDGRINALTNQRNEANDRVVLLTGLLAERDMRIRELQEEVAKLQKHPEE